ncbi:MAG: nitronate monooxygenase family protein [Candidatus Neomarinimicrobiota bacterium]
MKQTLSEQFFKTGNQFLGTRYPILCGAMTWVSDPQLVANVCNAGGFASLAGGNTPVDILQKQILQTRELTDKPFGVNLITIAPLYRDHLQLVRETQPDFVIFAGSFPREKEVQIARESGARVMCFASTKSIADRMIRYGADALILEGMEAGGHVGQVTLTILLQQVLFEVSAVPVFVAGGIGSGKMCAHLLLMGAAGIQMGTRFAVAKEANTHAKFKERFIKADARDAIATPQIDSRLPVVAVRALRNKGHDEFSRLQLALLKKLDEGSISRIEAQMKVEEFWIGALRRAVVEGDVEHGSLMAGQSVGLVNKIQTIEEIIQEIVNDTEIELQRTRKLLCD